MTTAFVQSKTQASLVIGSPGEDVGKLVDAGSVTQLSISNAGPKPSRQPNLHRRHPGVQGQAGRNEKFGGSTRRWG